MAQFKVPDQYVGKSLSQIRNELNASFRPDVVASQSGINENVPLQAGQIISFPDDPGAGEYQFLKNTFGVYDAAQAALDAAKKEIEAEVSFLEQYTKDNPFVFDEQAAKESATAEYEPYYKQLLDEYLGGVELQRTNIQDERQLATRLYDLDTKARTRDYEYAIDNAERGFQGKGLFFSGLQARGTGQMEVEDKYSRTRAEEGYGAGQRDLSRREEGLNLESGVRKREMGEQQTEAIQSGILQRQKEAQLPYYYTFESAYKRRFPTGNQGVDAYLPSNYLRY